MSKKQATVHRLSHPEPTSGHELVTLLEVASDGSVFVERAGGQRERAWLATSTADAELLRAAQQHARALSLRMPTGELLLLALVRPGLDPEVVARGPGAATVEADRSLTLRCGESAIELRADGRVTVRGADVLLSSSGTAAVQGAEVRIN